MNIFQKNCPECAAFNPVEAASCRCGHRFDPEALTGTDADAYARQQERLYCEYLTARLVQAEAELTAARKRLKADPYNTRNAAAAGAAAQAINALRAELKLRVSPRVSADSAAALPQKPTPRTAPTAMPGSAGTVRGGIPKPPIATLPQKPTPRIPPTAMPGSAVTARGGIPEPSMSSAGPAKNKQHAPPQPHGTAAPSERFRRLQAEKADTIARSNAVAPAGQSQPTSKPSAKSPAAPRPPAAAADTTEECPHCTATVTVDLARCRCGYVFSRASEEKPALSLDADALAILAHGTSLPKPPPRR